MQLNIVKKTKLIYFYISFYFQRYLCLFLIYFDKAFFLKSDYSHYKMFTVVDLLEQELGFQGFKQFEKEIDIIKKNISTKHDFPLIYDADKANYFLLYCLIRELKPEIIIETGVANGLSSNFILNAMLLNRKGVLMSIDLPKYPDQKVGLYVTPNLNDRWNLIIGSSIFKLKSILKQFSEIDMFIHDSANTYHFQKIEVLLAFKKLKKGGIIIINNIGHSNAFNEIIEIIKPHKKFVLRQEDKKGDFTGVIIK